MEVPGWINALASNIGNVVEIPELGVKATLSYFNWEPELYVEYFYTSSSSPPRTLFTPETISLGLELSDSTFELKLNTTKELLFLKNAMA